MLPNSRSVDSVRMNDHGNAELHYRTELLDHPSFELLCEATRGVERNEGKLLQVQTWKRRTEWLKLVDAKR